MAGRPKSAPWELGNITVRPHPTAKNRGKFQARARYRDEDGKQHPITATVDTDVRNTKNPTRDPAYLALKAKVDKHRNEHRGGDTQLNHDTPTSKAGQAWLAYCTTKARPLAPQTFVQYEANVKNYVDAYPIGNRALGKVNDVGVLETWLGAVANDHGNSAADAARRAMSGILKLAERRGAIPASVMTRVETPRAAAGSTGDRKCKDPECDLDCASGT